MGTRGAAEEVFEVLEPHLPAIIIFGVVYFVLRRAGMTNGLVWSIMAPLIFATIAEIIAELKWAYRDGKRATGKVPTEVVSGQSSVSNAILMADSWLDSYRGGRIKHPAEEPRDHK